jgi:putative two-component system response regulator
MTQERDKAAATVLIVDDEPHVRDIVRRWLSSEGYRCAEADCAEAAWNYLQQNDVQLVTLDVTMPGRSGLELLGDIAKGFPNVAAVMLTAAGHAQTAIDALSRGASAYLLKPFMRDELLFHVRRALERQQLVRESRQCAGRVEEQVRRQTVALRRTQEEIIHRLVSAALRRDGETGRHVQRVGLVSELLAKAAGWSDADAEQLRMAAPLHDLGKIGIPDAILCKPGRLTQQEFEVVKTHAAIGAQILAGAESPLLRLAEEVAQNHHERWDGEGYPRGVARDAIPESARIVAIADVFDAATHHRTYRPAIAADKALEIVRDGGGTQFDPLLLAHFFALLPDIERIAAQYPDPPATAAPTAAPAHAGCPAHSADCHLIS